MSLSLWESLPREYLHVPRGALSRETTVPAAPSGVVTLPAAERLASRFYADLSMLAARLDGATLGYMLLGRPPDDPTPEPLEDDSRLALRLVAADVEQLWRDQLIAAAALALVTTALPDADATMPPRFSSATPSPRRAEARLGGEDPSARCLLVYRVRPEPEMLDTTDAPGGDSRAHTPGLAAGDGSVRQKLLQLPSRLPRNRLSLLLSWTPAIARRSWVFPRSVYTFQWEPECAITLDRDGSPRDDDANDADQWTICRLRRPSVLR